MSVKIYSHNVGSRGARELSRALDARILRREGSRYVPRNGDTIINWGSSTVPPELRGVGPRILNQPWAVEIAQDKLRFFQHVTRRNNETPRVPDWTADEAVARSWLADGAGVVARTVLRGHSGAGIHIHTPDGGGWTRAPLYTKYVPKQAEYRLHFLNGEQIDAQRKIRDPNREPRDWHVRSHDNGFIFAREGLVLPADVVEQGRRAIIASGLDFGAVDIIWNERRGMAYVLEINTAPGLEGQTVQSYANAFRRLIRQGA